MENDNFAIDELMEVNETLRRENENLKVLIEQGQEQRTFYKKELDNVLKKLEESNERNSENIKLLEEYRESVKEKNQVLVVNNRYIKRIEEENLILKKELGEKDKLGGCLDSTQTELEETKKKLQLVKQLVKTLA